MAMVKRKRQTDEVAVNLAECFVLFQSVRWARFFLFRELSNLEAG